MELGLGLLLVGKGLHHLQPLDDLLDVSVYLSKCLLLNAVKFAALPAEGFEYHNVRHQSQDGGQKQNRADEEHNKHNARKHQNA
ncbi:hypothetical protein SDC9_204207 [bioreactor metagenome]|uniref:Uncharacterized protein n=1 Tax=bioreactor metagenome TaxID=1076179 RepID=A0A645IZC3_9ZZZZ